MGCGGADWRMEAGGWAAAERISGWRQAGGLRGSGVADGWSGECLLRKGLADRVSADWLRGGGIKEGGLGIGGGEGG